MFGEIMWPSRAGSYHMNLFEGLLVDDEPFHPLDLVSNNAYLGTLETIESPL